MMLRSAFVMTYFLPDFRPEKLSQTFIICKLNVYSVPPEREADGRFFNNRGEKIESVVWIRGE